MGHPNAKWADRLFAWLMAHLGPKAEWRFEARKLELFAGLRRDQGVHTVVEVGMGAAPNLKLYAPFVDAVVGVDVNPAMHQYARRAAEAAGVGAKLRLLTGAAEALPLEDGSADAVIMTHVLCSVHDPLRALAEARRVLRPGGRLLFLEHVAAPPGTALNALQRVLDPAVRLVGRGCTATRRTLQSLDRAGFTSLNAEAFDLGLWWPAAVCSPHIVGCAVR